MSLLQPRKTSSGVRRKYYALLLIFFLLIPGLGAYLIYSFLYSSTGQRMQNMATAIYYGYADWYLYYLTERNQLDIQTLTLYYLAHQNWITQHPQIGPYDYIVGKWDNGTIYALSGETGTVVYTSDNIVSLISNILDNNMSIFVRKGIYDVNNVIGVHLFKDNITFIGDYPLFRLVKDDGYAEIFRISGNEIVFQNFVLDGMNQTYNDRAIFIRGNNTRIENVKIVNIHSVGIGFGANIFNVTIRNCEISQGTSPLAWAIGNMGDVYGTKIQNVTIENVKIDCHHGINFDLVNATNIKIINCDIKGDYSDGGLGISVAANETCPMSRLYIIGTRVWNFGDQDVHIEQNFTKDVFVSNCYFGRTKRFTSFAYGVAVGQGNGDIIIINSVFEGASWNGIGLHLRDGAVAILDSLIIRNCNRTGIAVNGDNTTTVVMNNIEIYNVSMESNTYYGVIAIYTKVQIGTITVKQTTGSSAPLYGIKINCGNNSVISNGIVYGNYNAIFVDSSYYVIINSVNANGGWHGTIAFDYSYNCSVTDSILQRHSTYGAIYSTNSDYLLIDGNIFYGTGLNYSLSGSNNVIGDNLG